MPITDSRPDRGGAGDTRDDQVSLVQDNNPSDEARAHSEKNWVMMLDGLKKLLEP